MHRWKTLGAVAITGVAALAALPGTAGAVGRDVRRDGPAYRDARSAARTPLGVARNGAPAVRSLAASLGGEGIVSLDAATGTPRIVARLDGFLTGRSSARPSAIALGYVRAHQRVFRLGAADLAGLRLRRDYVDIAGTHHLSFVQTAGGVPVFGNGLRANVARDGRLINLLDAPVAGLRAPSLRPRLSAWSARNRALRQLGARPAGPVRVTRSAGPRRATRFAGGDRASLVLFATRRGTHLGWQLDVHGNDQRFTYVIDARTGRTLYRRNMIDNANALVVLNRPGAATGGTQEPVDLTAPGWLAPGATVLSGNNAHAYSDVNDDNTANPAEEVTADTAGDFVFALQTFALAAPCGAGFPCTWDPSTPFSWQTNRAQSTTQLFALVNRFHDHLAAAPIGFTEAAGNFQSVNASGQGLGGDALEAQALDGADTAAGLPDGNHIDNANMGTPPDGQSPTMQMYLWQTPGDPTDPFLAANGTDDANIVYHEYTHGLSNRLVVDANGVSTLGGIQAGAMGEAWSDWYAMDLLVREGSLPDTAAPGELRIGDYVGVGQDLIRTEPIDCPVGTVAATCPFGGYTYGNYAQIIGIPEVHADGEIWGQTLWDLRGALGSDLAESLVTRAMELAPSNPSFLDMRNSILQADTAVNGSAAHDAIWSVFAARGMGYFAAAANGDDTHPIESFDLPPAAGGPTGSIQGRIRDAQTGRDIAGAVVAFGGHTSGFADDIVGATDRHGRYAIGSIPVGTYPGVSAAKAGYDTQVIIADITPTRTRRNFDLVRDWAAGPGGAAITAFDGPDFTDFGCGPGGAIDQSFGSGWGSTTDIVNGVATPKTITIRLPRAVDITSIGVDPSNTCGDGGSASTGPYRIETSRNGLRFREAAAGTFTRANRGRLNLITPNPGTGTRVQYLRFTAIAPQVPGPLADLCPGPFSGCDFLDLTEIEVYGSRAGD